MASSSVPKGTAVPSALPEWIRVRPPRGAAYPEVKAILGELGLGTVCREAHCPNLPECWSAGTATLMLLGTDCTRRCSFCAVTTHWPRGVVDPTEPARVAEAVRRWGLRYVVLTQVCRDDLVDGGASVLVDIVRKIRAGSPGTLIELLIGDLGGKDDSLGLLLEAPPDVLGHNLETVRSLSSEVRDRRAGYDRSLSVLRAARRLGPSGLVTKSSLMLGLGESEAEVETALRDLRSAEVDLLTLGQYLPPDASHYPVHRYVPPDEFSRWEATALSLGFLGAACGPLVRSSYRAEQLYRSARTVRVR